MYKRLKSISILFLAVLLIVAFCFVFIGCGSGGDSATDTTDTTTPSVPSGLTATAVSETQIDLSWVASTDDTAVVGYNIYRDSSTAILASVTDTSASDTQLITATGYCYEVSAYDAAGNESVKSTQVCAATIDLTNGLVAYYPFNGNALDESGNGNDGTVVDAVLTTDRLGAQNSAYSFDGSQDYITIPYSTDIPTGNASRTLSMWLYTEEASWVTDTNNVFCYGTQLGQEVFCLDMAPYPRIELWNDGWGIVVETDVSQTGWMHVAFVYDNVERTMAGYVNGELKRIRSDVTGLNTGISDVQISGAPFWSDNCFLGKIDEVRIYDRALKDVEIFLLSN